MAEFVVFLDHLALWANRVGMFIGIVAIASVVAAGLSIGMWYFYKFLSGK